MKKRIISICLASAMLLALAVYAAEPGSSDDPLISKSYIDGVLLPQVRTMINDAALGSGEHAAPDSFVVVGVDAGQTIIGDAGCEMIIRQGGGTIIATEKGGICDVTLGDDLANGTVAPPNHLLIIPVGDGRGIAADSYTLIMVKGGYSISEEGI